MNKPTVLIKNTASRSIYENEIFRESQEKMFRLFQYLRSNFSYEHFPQKLHENEATNLPKC